LRNEDKENLSPYRSVVTVRRNGRICGDLGHATGTVATQVMQIVSGPIALLLIIAGFAGAGIIYFLGRNFEVAFVTLAALAIGGVLCSQIQTMATFLFPLAGALVR
jgi:hypothetical protein